MNIWCRFFSAKKSALPPSQARSRGQFHESKVESKIPPGGISHNFDWKFPFPLFLSGSKFCSTSKLEAKHMFSQKDVKKSPLKFRGIPPGGNLLLNFDAWNWPPDSSSSFWGSRLSSQEKNELNFSLQGKKWSRKINGKFGHIWAASKCRNDITINYLQSV